MSRHSSIWRKIHDAAGAIPPISARNPQQTLMPNAWLPMEPLEPRLLLSAVSFNAVQTYAAGSWPWAVASADFNKDGNLDLVATNWVGNTVSVLLGGGTGTFGSKADYPAGNTPRGVAVADLNNDGNLDLAVPQAGSDVVGELHGNGTGAFFTPGNYATDRVPCSVVAGDFNKDGYPDLAVANQADDTITVMLNYSDGSFSAYYRYYTRTEPDSVTTADVNKDGNLDLVVTCLGSNAVCVLLGSGTGTFADEISYAVGSQPHSVTSADFNEDGYPDLAIANIASDTVSVLLNNGDGTFAHKVDYSTGTGPASVVSADFNRDGYMDLAVTNSGSDTISLLSGVGDGTFAAKTDFAAGSYPEGLIAADFNKDGKSDLAVADYHSDSLGVLLNNTAMPPTVTVSPLATSVKTPTLLGIVKPTASGNTISSVSVTVGGQTLAATLTGRYWFVAVPAALSNGVYNVTATATDNEGNVGTDSTTNELTIDTIAPTDIALSSTSVAEYKPTGTPVGSFSTSDLSASDSFTYSLVSGTGGGDNTSFSIIGNQLASNAVFDYAARSSYSIRVRSTDQAGLYTEKAFTIYITSNPLVSLTTPAISSTVNQGDVYRISWTGGSASTTVQLWAYGPNGWNEIADGLPASQTYYDWNTTTAPHGWYCFSAHVNPGSGTWYTTNSPNWVHVVNPTNHAPIVVLTTSSSAETITRGATYSITWIAADLDGDAMHLSLWAWSADTGWFAIPGASWLDPAIGPFLWNTTSQRHGWYTIAAHVWDGSEQGVAASPNWLHIVQPTAQMPTFAFTTPASGQTVTHGSSFSLNWTATIPAEDVGKMKVQLWVCYLDWRRSNTPVWTMIAANLNPATGSYAWDTTSLSTDYQWYSFGAWIGYDDLWISSTSTNWLHVI